jgi:HK97 family phage major capsid protein
MAPSYAAVFGHWLANAVKTRSANMAFSMLTGREQAALSEGQDASGGFFVPADTAADLLGVVRDASPIARDALTLATDRDRLNVPVGDVWTPSWIGEVPAAADAGTITFRQVEISLKKAALKARVSNDLLADQPSLLRWLAATGGRVLAEEEDRQFLMGTGGVRPNGFVLDPAVSATDVEGSTANTISNSVTDRGSAPKLITLSTQLPGAMWERARWLMAGATLASILTLVTNDNALAFPPYASNGEPMLLHHPISVSSGMALEGSDGARVITLADLTQYIIVQRGLVSLEVYGEAGADLDQTTIYLKHRVGGTLRTTDAARVGTV